MDELLVQLMGALDAKLYFLAVVGAMAVPDIGGAVDSEEGIASGARYKEWANQYFGVHYRDTFTGADLYQFRCSLLHQGRLKTDPTKTDFARLVLTEPSQLSMHRNTSMIAGVKVVQLDASLFVRDMVTSARSWIAEKGGTDLFKRNMANCVTRLPHGLMPHFVGMPVIA